MKNKSEKQSKIIILRGNSGCGKTSTAKLLQKKLGHGTFLIQQDVVRREMLYVKDGIDTAAIQLLIELVSYGKRNSKIIILEGILKSSWYENLFVHIKELFKDEIYAYYFDVPFEETLKRHQLKPNAHEFGEEEMRRWWNQDDYIGNISEKIFNEENDQGEIADIILNEVIKE